MTKKFIYIGSDGEKEALSYEYSDFVTVATPSSPVKTLPSGILDPSIIPPIGTSAKSAALVITRIAAEDITSGQLLRAFGNSQVKIADSNIALVDATVMGIALNDALDTESVEVLVLGVITDIDFNVFTVNSPLFLDLDGAITDERPSFPTRKYLTSIGKSLGNGEVLITINQPVTLGA